MINIYPNSSQIYFIKVPPGAEFTKIANKYVKFASQKLPRYYVSFDIYGNFCLMPNRGVDITLEERSYAIAIIDMLEFEFSAQTPTN